LRKDDINDGHPGAGKKRGEGCAEKPGERRIEDVARFAEAVVGPEGPGGEEDALFPLIGDVEPGGGVEFEVVAGSGAAKEEGENDEKRDKKREQDREEPKRPGGEGRDGRV